MMTQLIYKVLLLAWRGACQFAQTGRLAGSADQGGELHANAVELFVQRLQDTGGG